MPLTKIAVAQHVEKRAELLNSGGKGSVETVKASAAIRKDLKELEALKQELTEIHQAEEKKAIKKARSVRVAHLFCRCVRSWSGLTAALCRNRAVRRWSSRTSPSAMRFCR